MRSNKICWQKVRQKNWRAQHAMKINNIAGVYMKHSMSMFAACAVVFAAVVFTGCSKKNSSKDSMPADLLEKIQDSGEMTVAMEGTWAPWTYHDESGVLVGFDVDVAKLVAAKLGVEAKFIEGEWSGLFAGIDSGRYDVVINGVEITPERSEKYDFSEPYAFIRTALVVRSDNDAINSFEDLKGKNTANSISSTYMTIAESYGAKAAGVETLDQTFELVLSKRVDATLNAEVSFADYMRVHPDAQLKVVSLTKDASNVAIPMRKGSETKAFREAVNKAIAELRENGQLKAVSEKYFGRDITAVQR